MVITFRWSLRVQHKLEHVVEKSATDEHEGEVLQVGGPGLGRDFG
jgi:hypothetical protein